VNPNPNPNPKPEILTLYPSGPNSAGARYYYLLLTTYYLLLTTYYLLLTTYQPRRGEIPLYSPAPYARGKNQSLFDGLER
jgi:hypothetical protein